MPRDTWLVLRHAIEPTLRAPASVVIGLAQPVFYLVLFGPLLAGMRLPGAGDSWQVFLPGMLLMIAIFSAGFAGFALIPDLRSGVLERMRVSPLSRTALLLGRVLRDVVIVLVQTVLLVALSFVLFGLRVPLDGFLLGLALLGLLSVSLASVSYLLATKLRNEYAFAPVIQSVSMPLLLSSGALIPMDVGPEWLRIVSRLNPLTYVLDAERSLFTGGLAEPELLTGVAVSLALAVVALVWGARAFAKADA